MKGDTIAKRYAQALFAIGKEKDGQAKGEQGKSGQEIEHYGAILNALAKALTESEALARLFRAPVISGGEKDRVVQNLLGKLEADSVMCNFFRLLAEKERLVLLPTIAELFGKLADQATGIARGTLTTAVKLDDKRCKSVVTALEKQSSNKLKLNFEVNPAILGGMVLRMGDMVLDGSLKAQLNVLKENIKRGE